MSYKAVFQGTSRAAFQKKKNIQINKFIKNNREQIENLWLKIN